MVSLLGEAESAPDADGVRGVIDEVCPTALGYSADESQQSTFVDLLEIIEQEKAGVLNPAIPDLGPLIVDMTPVECPF